jgi:rhomboid protease GluP
MKQRQSLTTSLIVVISGAYLLTYLFPNLQSELALFYGGTYANGYFPGVATGQWYRLLTVALTHAGWMHLIFNMLALYSIGTPVEIFVGKFRFAIIFTGSLWCSLCYWEKIWSKLPEHCWNNNRQPFNYFYRSRN